jgi:hypothetical protein
MRQVRFDSRKGLTRMNDGRSWAPLAERTYPRSTTHFTKPSTPPERWVRAMNDPMRALNIIMRVFPRSANTATMDSRASCRPARGFPPSRMIQPSQIPAKSETKTCFVRRAVAMAMKGGSRLSQVGFSIGC